MYVLDLLNFPPNSADLNPLNYHVWGAMLDHCKCYYLAL